jgi:hypothetical protein
MRHLILISVGLFFICSSCGIILQNSGTKNFKDPITKTSEYKSLNKFQKDFLYLSVVCDKYFPNADRYFPKDQRQIVEREILKNLENRRLSDLEFRLHLKKYLSNFNNQHTWISLKGVSITGIYPFMPYNIDSSWYLLNASKIIDKDFIGQRISAFNNASLNNYERQLFEFVSAENITTKRKAISNWWFRPTYHEFISGKQIDSVKLTFENGRILTIPKITSGNLMWHLSEKDFKQHPITKTKDRIYDYQIIDSIGTTYFQFHECYDKIEMKEGIKSYVKPWLRPIANWYVNIQTSKKKPSERLKKYFDPERPVFSKYVAQMVKESNEKGISKLIIDLRNNNGGSELICLQLLYHLTNRQDLADFDLYVHNGDFYKHYFKNDFEHYVNGYYEKHSKYPIADTLFHAGQANSKENLFDKITAPNSPYFVQKDRPIFNGKIVVIADFSTHSAGALFTTLLQDNKVAQVVGTDVSNNPTGPTTWTPFKLPNSKIEVSISSQYLVRPDKTKTDKFTPDFYIEKSIQDIMRGHDPLFEKALEILSKD